MLEALLVFLNPMNDMELYSAGTWKGRTSPEWISVVQLCISGATWFLNAALIKTPWMMMPRWERQWCMTSSPGVESLPQPIKRRGPVADQRGSNGRAWKAMRQLFGSCRFPYALSVPALYLSNGKRVLGLILVFKTLVLQPILHTKISMSHTPKFIVHHSKNIHCKESYEDKAFPSHS